MERLKKQMGFIVEVDKVKKIIRQTYLADSIPAFPTVTACKVSFKCMKPSRALSSRSILTLF